jgi:hypothetical protein
MEKEIEIIKISDTSEDESERVLKERKREDAIRELGKAIKEGRWMRSDVVAALAIYKWRQVSKDMKGVFINDNVVTLTQPLKKQDQFVAIAKEFKKWAFQPFKCARTHISRPFCFAIQVSAFIRERLVWYTLIRYTIMILMNYSSIYLGKKTVFIFKPCWYLQPVL